MANSTLYRVRIFYGLENSSTFRNTNESFKAADPIPCQDYGDCKVLNDVIIGAVADGAGSAKYADIGAQIAIKTALGYLTGVEEWLQKRKRFWQLNPQLLSEKQARKLL